MNLILHGAAGHMGRILRQLIESRGDMELAACVDASGAEGCLSSLDLYSGFADCLIDFSSHLATDALLAYALRHALPLVIATTGQTDTERESIARAAKEIPIFFSANMSPAIAMLANMAAQAAKMFPDADIEIIERHHNRKVDVPSGTALLLARAIQAVRPDARLVVGRHANGAREKGDIGIHSLRLGNETGVHEIILAAGNQTITLKHEAEDRALFAEGALNAAEFIVRQPAGLYDMRDLVRAD